MKRLIALLLMLTLVLPIGFVQANAKFDESVLYGDWELENKKSFYPYPILDNNTLKIDGIRLCEGGIGLLSIEGSIIVCKWEIKNQYINIEAVAAFEQIFMVLRIDQREGRTILTDMLWEGCIFVHN